MPTHQPRINVVVTEEQRALLLELAELDPQTRSASAFLRALLDRVTPLLRTTVAAMRVAAQESDTARSELHGLLAELATAMKQLELPAPSRSGRSEPQRSEDAPPRSRRRRK